MNQENNIQQGAEPTELLDESLEEAAGGGIGNGIGGVDVGIRKKPGGQPSGSAS